MGSQLPCQIPTPVFKTKPQGLVPICINAQMTATRPGETGSRVLSLTKLGCATAPRLLEEKRCLPSVSQLSATLASFPTQETRNAETGAGRRPHHPWKMHPKDLRAHRDMSINKAVAGVTSWSFVQPNSRFCTVPQALVACCRLRTELHF